MASLPHLPQPELLNTPVASEPADKWASNTLEAVSGEESRINDLPSSNVSTPGPNVPGAFPRPLDVSTIQSDVEYVKNTAYSALETAKDYVGNAGEKMTQYIPAGVSAYLPTRSANNSQSKSDSYNGLESVSGESLAKLPEERKLEVLPSHDDESYTPLGRTDGVGRLPGDSTEAGVAKLPDEREEERITGTSSKDLGTSPAANGLDAVSGKSVAKLPEESRQESLPSHDDENAVPLGRSAGVGTLPGTASESGVATLPEERAQDTHSSTQSYLNPNFTQSPDPNPAVKPTALPPRNVPENPRSNAMPNPTSSHSSSAGTTGTQGGRADTDASTRTLVGSHVNADTNVPPTPPPKSEKSELETFREHDSATHSDPKAVLISSAQESKKKHEHDPIKVEYGREKGTVSKSAGERTEGELQDVGANKSLNTSPRTHPLAAAPATFNSIPLSESHQQYLDSHPSEQLNLGQPSHGKLVGASVPEKDKGRKLEINSPRNEGPTIAEKMETKRVDSTTATTGHEGQGAGMAVSPVPGGGAGSKVANAIHGRERTSEDRRSSGSEGSTGSAKKPGFMSKVKGEMKILSGKLGHKEEKIEEGRKMMGKN